MGSFGDRYILSSDRSGHDRLRMLCEIHDPQTHALLRKAGVGSGKSFVEFGSGLGYVVRWAASLGASATGVDLSEEHLEEARRMAAEAKLRSVEFRCRNIYEHGLEPGRFDFAYCRFVLSHLSRRIEAMRAMAESLAPGGLLVCEEPDLTTLYAEPRSAAYDRVLSQALAAGAAREADYEYGRKLHVDAAAAGLEVVSVDTYQLHYLSGSQKNFWTWTFVEGAEGIRAAGALSEDEMTELLDGMRKVDDDPTVLVGHPRVHQLTARKPF